MDLGFENVNLHWRLQKAQIFYSGYASKPLQPNILTLLEVFEGKGMDVKIIKIEGSVELAPLLGLSDAIIDIVETGSTLKEKRFGSHRKKSV